DDLDAGRQVLSNVRLALGHEKLVYFRVGLTQPCGLRERGTGDADHQECSGIQQRSKMKSHITNPLDSLRKSSRIPRHASSRMPRNTKWLQSSDAPGSFVTIDPGFTIGRATTHAHTGFGD